MIERQHAEFVFGLEQLEEESLHRGTRIDEPLPEHAVADVEQHGEADRHALVGELADGLPLAVFEDFECLSWQAADEVSFFIDDRGGDGDEIDARAEAWSAVLRENCRAGHQGGNQRQTEGAAHAPMLQQRWEPYAAAARRQNASSRSGFASRNAMPARYRTIPCPSSIFDHATRARRRVSSVSSTRVNLSVCGG